MAVAKKSALIMIAFSFAIITFSGISLASPSLSPAAFRPSTSLWLGENLSVSVNCSESEPNLTIREVWANLNGPGISFQNMKFSGNSPYYLNLSNYHLASPGSYSLEVICENSLGANSSTIENFYVSELAASITEVSPQDIYSSGDITVYFEMSKDGSTIDSMSEEGPYFSIFIDGNRKSLKVNPPGYYSGKGWGLIIGPEEKGSYTIEVDANYSRMRMQDSVDINVKDDVELSIKSINDTQLNGGESISIELEAYDRGEAIDLNENNTDFFIGGISLEPTSFTKTGNTYKVQLTAPILSPNQYFLTARLLRSGNSYIDEKEVYYLISASGKITDGLDKPLYVQMDFMMNGIKNMTITTDSSGSYSSGMQPGTYDMNIKFPKSTAFFKDVSISSFNDPLKHDSISDPSIPGLNAIAAYFFELGLPYEYADLELSYNEKLVDDERDLRVFSCQNWNSGRRSCNSNWIEEDADFDYVRNVAKVHTTSLAAYAIGMRQNLTVFVGTDKPLYYMNDTIKISGYVSSGNSRIENASVRVWIPGTAFSQSMLTGPGGEFSTAFTAAMAEGNYTVYAEAEKSPFGKITSSKRFEAVKKADIYIGSPATIRAQKGSNYIQKVDIMNTGQLKLTGISVEVSGLPDEWVSLGVTPSQLEVGEKADIEIEFFVPDDAAIATSSASILVKSNEIEKEKKIGFTVTENTSTAKIEANNTPSGSVLNFALPNIAFDNIIIAAIVAALAPIILAIRAVRIKKKKEYSELLGEMKGMMKAGEKQKEIPVDMIKGSKPSNSNPSQALSQQTKKDKDRS